MPETRFDDILIVNPKGHKKVYVPIDSEYIFVCEEDSIKPISYVPSSPCVCGMKIQNSMLYLEIDGYVPEEIVVKLSGIRKGRLGRRFARYTKEEAYRNTQFWDSWKND
jgi:hypothetical protein